MNNNRDILEQAIDAIQVEQLEHREIVRVFKSVFEVKLYRWNDG